MNFVNIDVSEQVPPEPMTNIMMSLAKLQDDECLLVKHSRQPFPLYEKLQQAGWLYHCEQVAVDHIRLYIFAPELQKAVDTLIIERYQKHH